MTARAPPKGSNKVLIEITVVYRGNGVSNAQTIDLPDGYKADPNAMAFWLREQLRAALLEAGRAESA